MILIQTSKGDIRIQLDEEKTPETAANFLSYARRGFYNDTIFHRVIGGFMIQGGGLTADFDTKSTDEPIKNEAKSGKLNHRGTLAMARTSDPHSATSQFFINLADNAFLNYKGEQQEQAGYCVFGEVVEGMEIVDLIAKVKTGQRKGHGDVPLEDVAILSVSEEGSQPSESSSK
ncbi:MAG: peptidylprolyl isomerase [Legionellales bacterium]|nr:peptidylprolyl isomerase [Legionellales bacterium]